MQPWRDFAYITYARRNPYNLKALIVQVCCPWCNRTHQHGLPEGYLIPGDSRTSDCIPGGPYVITDPDGVLK